MGLRVSGSRCASATLLGPGVARVSEGPRGCTLLGASYWQRVESACGRREPPGESAEHSRSLPRPWAGPGVRQRWGMWSTDAGGEQGCSGWRGGVATTALSCFAPRTRPGFIFGPVFARGLCRSARAWVVVVVGGGVSRNRHLRLRAGAQASCSRTQGAQSGKGVQGMRGVPLFWPRPLCAWAHFRPCSTPSSGRGGLSASQNCSPDLGSAMGPC